MKALPQLPGLVSGRTRPTKQGPNGKAGNVCLNCKKKKMKLILLIFTLTLMACSSRTVELNNPGTISQKDSLIQPESQKETPSNSFETDEDCVIFLMPGDSEIEKMQKEYPEENYNEIIADITWYPGIASEYLDSIGIKYKMVDNQNILILKGSNGVSIYLQKNKITGDMILFRKDTLPVIGHAIDFDRAFTKNFFRKNN